MSQIDYKLIEGRHCAVHQLNESFGQVSTMLLEHFDTPAYSNVVFSLGTYIHSSAEQLQKQFPGARIIIYQLEQLMDTGTMSARQIVENVRGASEIWDYDTLNIQYLKYYGIQADRHVPLLYTHGLERVINREDPEIDVLFYGWINPRRSVVFQRLQAEFYGRVKLAWVYGTFDLDTHIANSKVVLNLHASEPWNRQEQVRMFYPVINGKAVVSEPSQINNMVGEIVESGFDEMTDELVDICYSDRWRALGLNAKERFRTRTEQFLSTNAMGALAT